MPPKTAAKYVKIVYSTEQLGVKPQTYCSEGPARWSTQDELDCAVILANNKDTCYHQELSKAPSTLSSAIKM